MTTLIATTVTRGAAPREAHGAVHLLDLEGRRAAQAISWTRPGTARQGEQGLRGIAFTDAAVYFADSDCLYRLSTDFELRSTHRSAYLADCQQVALHERRLYVVSAAYDAILAFDLDTQRFEWGLHLADDGSGHRGTPFEPRGTLGPPRLARLGLDAVHCDSRGMFVSGLSTLGLLHFDGRRIKRLVTLPAGARNARPWRDGVLFNDGEAGCTRLLSPQQNRVFRAPMPPPPAGADRGATEAGLYRGLCVIDGATFAAGSAPATITVHDVGGMQTRLSVNLAEDPRVAIHSLAVWPFGTPATQAGISG